MRVIFTGKVHDTVGITAALECSNGQCDNSAVHLHLQGLTLTNGDTCLQIKDLITIN